jgi:hypothetical protein
MRVALFSFQPHTQKKKAKKIESKASEQWAKGVGGEERAHDQWRGREGRGGERARERESRQPRKRERDKGGGRERGEGARARARARERERGRRAGEKRKAKTLKNRVLCS